MHKKLLGFFILIGLITTFYTLGASATYFPSVSSCPKGEFIAESNFSDNTICFPCDSISIRYTDQKNCAACPNRYMISDEGCVLKKCPKNHFVDNMGSCSDCSDDRAFSVRENTKAAISCFACLNRYITPNGYCAKKCDKNQFMDVDSDCWDCSNGAALPIGSDPKAIAACLACPDRYINADGKCAKKCGKNQIVDAGGSCWDCSDDAARPIGSDPKAIASCTACPDRYINAYGYCAKKEEARP